LRRQRPICRRRRGSSEAIFGTTSTSDWELYRCWQAWIFIQAASRIRLLLDNHSSHTSKETQGWLSLHPNRFEFVFTPKHGSWLNIVETMFSKMARSMLRGIRVASKQELIDRIHLYFQMINADPVIFRWKYKMDETLIG
jgi:transposase